MGEFIQSKRERHLLTITLDRPEVLNALHAPACCELSRILDDFAADDDLWIAIITGTGRAFCAGHDVKNGFHDPMPPTGWAGLSRRYDLFKPMIAAVNGLAVGGGWEIALACDIVVADENAVFSLPEPRVGAIATGGGARRLPQRVPWHVAMGLLLTGNRIDARTAAAHGLVTEIAPPGQAMAVARRYVDDMLRCAPLSLRATKQLALASVEHNAADVQAMATDLAERNNQTFDNREGVAAFTTKRPPVWRGR
ncbi:enoyl-CoA hydratase-related protein [Sphingobium sp.]|uniref:enoyl-CoA hydratase-related protein n=1 Tax=Sphingobium sp. TaxID=1912891 RepID=UPI003B3AD300